MMRTALLLLALMTLPAAGGVGPAAAAEPKFARIVDLRVGHHPTYDRLVIEFDREPTLNRLSDVASGAVLIDAGARYGGSGPPIPEKVKRIVDVFFEPLPTATRIRVRGTGPLRVFRLHDPPRLVIDVAEPGTVPFEPPPGTEGLRASPEKAGGAPRGSRRRAPKPPTPKPEEKPEKKAEEAKPKAAPEKPQPAPEAPTSEAPRSEAPKGAEAPKGETPRPGAGNSSPAGPEPKAEPPKPAPPEASRPEAREPPGPPKPGATDPPTPPLARAPSPPTAALPPPRETPSPAPLPAPKRTPADGDLPPCARTCPDLADRGELRHGVAVIACTLRFCEEEARQLYAKGEFEEALRALDHIREGRDGMPAYELDRGLVLYALGRYEEAVGAFDRTLARLPTSLRAGAQRGHALARLGRLDEALAQFEKLLELPGVAQEFKEIRTNSYLLGNIGAIQLRQGKLAQGKESARKALDEDGNNALAATMLYRVVPALESGSLDPSGIGDLERAYEELALGRHQQAVAGFESVVTRWPAFEATWWVLGEIHFARLDYAACEDVYARAAEHVPATIDFKIERLRCRILRYGASSEQGHAAVSELRSLADADPENSRAKDLLFALDL